MYYISVQITLIQCFKLLCIDNVLKMFVENYNSKIYAQTSAFSHIFTLHTLWIHACMQVHIHMHVYLYIKTVDENICIHIHVCTYKSRHTCTHIKWINLCKHTHTQNTHTHPNISACTYTQRPKHIHRHAETQRHAYTHTKTCIHTHKTHTQIYLHVHTHKDTNTYIDMQKHKDMHTHTSQWILLLDQYDLEMQLWAWVAPK